MLKIHTEVEFGDYKTLGFSDPPFSGMSPSLKVNDQLIMCRIFSVEGFDKMSERRKYKVLIELPYGEKFQSILVKGMEFTRRYHGSRFRRKKRWIQSLQITTELLFQSAICDDSKSPPWILSIKNIIDSLQIESVLQRFSGTFSHGR